MRRVYKNDNGDTADLFYAQKSSSEGFNTLLMTIRHPNQEIMSLFDSIFRYHNINPNVSVIEMIFDFYVDDTGDFCDLLKYHLFHKNQRSRSWTYKGNTFYTNDLRRSSRGMRLYRKLSEEEQKFVRLELVLHRSIIHRLGLQFPLSNIDSLDVSRFFYFARLKAGDLRKYRIWQQRELIGQLRKTDPFEADLIEAHVESWLRIPLLNAESLMGQVEALRHDLEITNYYRFLDPFDDLNRRFFSLVSSQKFIPPRRRKNERGED